MGYISKFGEVVIGKESFWICKKCKGAPVEEHNHPPCHTCEDWNGCGRDCTLSKLSCKKCRIEEKV